MIVSLLLLASTTPISVVQITNADQWMASIKFPDNFAPQGLLADVSVVVDENGKAVRCDITNPSGKPEFDRFLCVAMVTRGKFKSAIDQTGKPSIGLYPFRFRWNASPGAGGRTYVPDVELNVTKMPKIGRSGFVRAALVTDAQGLPVACAFVEKRYEPSLETAVCGALVKMNGFAAIRLADNQQVGGVHNVSVGFVLDRK